MFRFLNFLTRACAEVTELFKIVTVMFTTAYGALVDKPVRVIAQGVSSASIAARWALSG